MSNLPGVTELVCHRAELQIQPCLTPLWLGELAKGMLNLTSWSKEHVMLQPQKEGRGQGAVSEARPKGL